MIEDLSDAAPRDDETPCPVCHLTYFAALPRCPNICEEERLP